MRAGLVLVLFFVAMLTVFAEFVIAAWKPHEFVEGAPRVSSTLPGRCAKLVPDTAAGRWIPVPERIRFTDIAVVDSFVPRGWRTAYAEGRNARRFGGGPLEAI